MKVPALVLVLLTSVTLFASCGSPYYGPGGGTCIGGGGPCQTFADCCSGTCDKGKCAGGGCTPTGGSCLTHGDCCTDSCLPNEICDACLPDGVACHSNANCCSDHCMGGLCHP